MIDALIHPEHPMPPDRAAPTLFLDRDGVINARPMGDGPTGYVKSWDEFEFLPGVLETLAGLNAWRVVVVTNQRGVARGYMTLADVRGIHERMIADIAGAGGRIDAVYCCPDMDGPDRKPEPGMLLRAMADHPGIDPERSIIVGDAATDIVAGHRAGVRGLLCGPEALIEDERTRLETHQVVPAGVMTNLKAAVDAASAVLD